MKTSLQTQRRKAISPIIATILVVAMTIVAAGVLYTYFTTTASRAQNTAQVQIQASLAVPSGSASASNPATGTLTVANSGSIALSAVSPAGTGFTFAPVSGNPSFPIAPGSGLSYTFTSTTAVAGVTYAITVVATFANGATQSQVVDVTAQ